MAKTVFVLIFTILISVSLQSPSFAAEINKPKSKSDIAGGLSISSTIGNYFFSRSEQLNIPPLYGIKVGYETIEKSVADSVGFEGTLNYFNARSKIKSGDTTGYLLRLDVTYPFPINKKWIPFIAVGVGGIAFDTDTASDRNFLLNYGVGIKYFIENYLAVRVDARQLGVFENALIQKNYEVSVGLSYYFGKERKKKSVALPAPEKKKIVVIEDIPEKKEDGAKLLDSKIAENSAVVVPAASPALPSTPEVPVIPIIKNELVKTISIEFDKNSSYIKPNYFMRLKEITHTLNSSDNLTAQIVGHADAGGKLTANLALSEQRAQNVRGYLLRLGANPNQLSITAREAGKSVADGSIIVEGKQKNRSVDVLIIKLDPSVKIKAEQDRKLEAARIENERLQAEILAKSRIKATIILQDKSGVLPVDSIGSLSFEITNRGVSTEEYMLTLIAPKEFDGVLTRANRPDEKITTLQLAPDETFKGSVQFRIPTGITDGQKTSLTVKAVSTKYHDVIFQKDSTIVSSAPLLRVVAKLAKEDVAPGETLRYHMTVLNAGSLPARNLSIQLQLPPQVDFIGAPGTPYNQSTTGLIVFKIDTIDSGSLAEIAVEMKVREDVTIGQKLLWNAEIIDINLQRRTKFTNRALIVQPK